MKIKLKFLCYICFAPLDPYMKGGNRSEREIFDMYLGETGLSFQNNISHFNNYTRVCKCCNENMHTKYNPKMHAMRQTGMLKMKRPKTNAISRDEMKEWVEKFYELLKE